MGLAFGGPLLLAFVGTALLMIVAGIFCRKRKLTPEDKAREDWFYHRDDAPKPSGYPYCTRCMYSALVCRDGCHKKTKPLYRDDPGIRQ